MRIDGVRAVGRLASWARSLSERAALPTVPRWQAEVVEARTRQTSSPRLQLHGEHAVAPAMQSSRMRSVAAPCVRELLLVLQRHRHHGDNGVPALRWLLTPVDSQ